MLQLLSVGDYSLLLYQLKSTPCERPALQGFTSSALLHNTIALPIPNAEKKQVSSIFSKQNLFF
jgi:hypothetical protein